jgi:hypothetical protein
MSQIEVGKVTFDIFLVLFPTYCHQQVPSL